MTSIFFIDIVIRNRIDGCMLRRLKRPTTSLCIHIYSNSIGKSLVQINQAFCNLLIEVAGLSGSFFVSIEQNYVNYGKNPHTSSKYIGDVFHPFKIQQFLGKPIFISNFPAVDVNLFWSCRSRALCTWSSGAIQWPIPADCRLYIHCTIYWD